MEFHNILSNLIRMHNINYIFLSEPWVSGVRVEDVICKMGRTIILKLDVKGFSGGL